ncbi:MauE/DoxX family redox-associated membrane protein [Streptomonospora wellingtoniae]|uniref:MauE/DoxX family redox-associated membrane protein n=1 Tax=Streptomonospora wellingtoniae TaxID=3075544 RepID=A0ABU2KT50_9ACTN|nr:MauE/DoxX family redox-associated membrane protein [Streptomonospora sp. DSM 45055]MDT0302462.1 MauE/DoxX family redox-associated membrane protein [Streptomonospora sp. DSM 45055]
MLPYAALALQMAVAGVFLVSAVAKFRTTANEETWSILVGLLPVQGQGFPVRAASRVHAAAELALGLTLLAGLAGFAAGTVLRAAALSAAVLLLSAFTALAAYAARSGTAIPCSCFGRSNAPLGWPHVWRNLALTGVALSGLVCTVAADPGAQIRPGGAAIAAVAALVVTVLTAFYDDIVDLFGTPDRLRRV